MLTTKHFLLLTGLVLTAALAGCSDDSLGCCCARRGDSGYWSCGPKTRSNCGTFESGVSAHWDWSDVRCVNGARREPPAGGIASIGF